MGNFFLFQLTPLEKIRLLGLKFFFVAKTFVLENILVKLGSVTAEILLKWTYVAWTNVTVGIR